MIRLDIFDGFTLIDMCLEYSTLKVTRKLRGVGSFSLELGNLSEGLKFSLGNYVSIDTDFYIVENIHKYKDSDKTVKVEVSGRHISQLLDERVIYKLDVPTTSSYETIIKNIVKDCYVTSTNTDRNVSNFTVTTPKAIHYPKEAYTLEKMSLAECLNHLCGQCELGYNLTLDLDNEQFNFSVIQPTDVRDEVVFSEEYGNVSNCDYYNNIDNVKNVCYSYDTEKDVETEVITGSGTGLNRKEMIIAGSYNDDLTDRYSVTNAAVEVISNGNYTYKLDYDLGYIVTFFDRDFNITTTRQLSEFTLTYGNSEGIELSIGDFVPTVFDKLKKGRN